MIPLDQTPFTQMNITERTSTYKANASTTGPTAGRVLPWQTIIFGIVRNVEDIIFLSSNSLSLYYITLYITLTRFITEKSQRSICLSHTTAFSITYMHFNITTTYNGKQYKMYVLFRIHLNSLGQPSFIFTFQYYFYIC